MVAGTPARIVNVKSPIAQTPEFQVRFNAPSSCMSGTANRALVRCVRHWDATHKRSYGPHWIWSCLHRNCLSAMQMRSSGSMHPPLSAA